MKKTYTLGGDMTVNRMGFGAMRITGKGIWGPPEDKAEALRVLIRAVELGVNFIDTANSYGPNISEELIAEALHPYPADLVIATKGGLTRSGPDLWHSNGDPDHLQKELEGSLKRLKLDRIDLYQLHRVDPYVSVEKTFGFLKKKQEEGLIRHIGLSEVDIDVIEQARAYFDVVSVQNKYSLAFRKWEPVLHYCREKHIAFIPWNPINAGNLGHTEVLHKMAGSHQANIYQLAMSWLLHHAENILLIPGTSKVDHLEENMQTLNISLHDKEISLIGSTVM